MLDNQTAGDTGCANCGLLHPSGGIEWKDCQPVYLPPHSPTCLHCGEPRGQDSYYQRHQRNHPYPVLGLGKFLLSGGDPNDFDPLRKPR